MKINKKAFTLLELMIVVTILWIIATFSYIPYNFYQNKIKLNLSSNIFSQTFYEAKNLAISWIVGEDSNSSIWLYVSKEEDFKNKLTFYKIPFDTEVNSINNLNDYFYREIFLQKNIFIDELWWKENLLFYYSSIDWDLSIYEKSLDSLADYTLPETIDITLSYWESDLDNLKKELIYFVDTNIIDYK